MSAASIRDILADLVAFDTTSSRSNFALLDYVENLLALHGVRSQRVSKTDHKANLWATIGPERDGGIILSGHTDCVPVVGQAWSSDPFKLAERDGRLFGRGTSDMKGFLACVLSLVPLLARTPREKPVHLAFSYDEEIGCVGVRDLITQLSGDGIRPSLCLVGEPTEMRAVIGHKGGRAYRCRIAGLEAHSSLAPHGVNAVEFAAELISFLRRLGKELAEGPRDEDFDLPYSTISVGMIEGGSAINIVANHCTFVFEYRNLAAIDQQAVFARIKAFADEELLPQMQKVWPKARIDFEPIYEYPAHELARDHPAVTSIIALLGEADNGKVAFGTEAGLFQRDLGVPSVVCGPGQIGVAHKPDEFVTQTQLDLCREFLRKLCLSMQATSGIKSSCNA